MIWLLANLAALAAFTWIAANRRLRSLDRGRRQVNGGRYISWNSFGFPIWIDTLHVQASMPVASSLEFEIRRKNLLSRMGGRLGLSGDLPIDNARLDAALHVVSHDSRLRGVLGHSPGLVADLQALVDYPAPGLTLSLLACRGGVLRLELAGVTSRMHRKGLADLTMLRLRSIASSLPVEPAAVGPSTAFRRAAWLQALSLALLANALLQGLRVYLFDGATIADIDRLHTLGLPLGLALLSGLVVASLLLLRRSRGLLSRTMATVLLAAGIGAPAHGLLLVRDVNIAFDFAAPEPVWGMVSMGSTPPRLGYVVGVTLEGVPREILRSVEWRRAYQYPPGATVVADRYEGALGIPWIGHIEAKLSRPR
jgi:hypothetical protein